MTANRLISILVVVHQRLLLLHRPRMVTYVANSPWRDSNEKVAGHHSRYSPCIRGVTRLDGARGKKQVWRPHDWNWRLSEANVLYEESSCDIVETFWRPHNDSAPGKLRPPRCAPALNIVAITSVRGCNSCLFLEGKTLCIFSTKNLAEKLYHVCNQYKRLLLSVYVLAVKSAPGVFLPLRCSSKANIYNDFVWHLFWTLASKHVSG